MTRYDVESINVGGVDGIAHVCMVDDAFVERAVYLADVHAQSTGSVCLWVGVHYEYRFL
ncbi:Uncharacterised protein [Segatella copri]|nr:Uncharacterised protein [Segatella copri]